LPTLSAIAFRPARSIPGVPRIERRRPECITLAVGHPLNSHPCRHYGNCAVQPGIAIAARLFGFVDQPFAVQRVGSVQFRHRLAGALGRKNDITHPVAHERDSLIPNHRSLNQQCRNTADPNSCPGNGQSTKTYRPSNPKTSHIGGVGSSRFRLNVQRISGRQHG